MSAVEKTKPLGDFDKTREVKIRKWDQEIDSNTPSHLIKSIQENLYEDYGVSNKVVLASRIRNETEFINLDKYKDILKSYYNRLIQIEEGRPDEETMISLLQIYKTVCESFVDNRKLNDTTAMVIIDQSSVFKGDNDKLLAKKNLRKCLLEIFKYAKSINLTLRRREKKTLIFFFRLMYEYYLITCPKLIHKRVYENTILPLNNPYLADCYTLDQTIDFYRLKNNLKPEVQVQISRALIPVTLTRYLMRKGKSQYSLKWE